MYIPATVGLSALSSSTMGSFQAGDMMNRPVCVQRSENAYSCSQLEWPMSSQVMFFCFWEIKKEINHIRFFGHRRRQKSAITTFSCNIFMKRSINISAMSGGYLYLRGITNTAAGPVLFHNNNILLLCIWSKPQIPCIDSQQHPIQLHRSPE